MAVTIYHNPKCSKSRETLKLIEARGIAPKIVEYLKNPPSADELARILKLLGLKPAQLLRPREASEAGIDPAALDDKSLIARMVAHPAAIERPIVVSGDKARIGRPPEKALEIL